MPGFAAAENSHLYVIGVRARANERERQRDTEIRCEGDSGVSTRSLVTHILQTTHTHHHTHTHLQLGRLYMKSHERSRSWHTSSHSRHVRTGTQYPHLLQSTKKRCTPAPPPRSDSGRRRYRSSSFVTRTTKEQGLPAGNLVRTEPLSH